MDLKVIWEQFIHSFSEFDFIQDASYKKAAGIPFLYLAAREDSCLEELEKAIRLSAARSMKGKQLHSETVFVRNEGQNFVFRHRFYVPQKKMFCCGNLCPDCIRLKKE